MPRSSTLLNSCPPIDSLGDHTIPVRIVSELIKNRVEQLQLNCHSSVSTAFGLDWTGVAVKGGTRDVVLEMYQYMHSFKIWHPCIAINILFSYIIISISLQFVYYLTWSIVSISPLEDVGKEEEEWDGTTSVMNRYYYC